MVCDITLLTLLCKPYPVSVVIVGFPHRRDSWALGPPLFKEQFRILKWRYVSTIFLAIFGGDIP
jgi:hypothetical protein